MDELVKGGMEVFLGPLPSTVTLPSLNYSMCVSWEVDFEVSLVAQMVKNLLAMQETWVQSLNREDPLEKEMATHSSILAWRVPRTEEPGGLLSMGLPRVGHD